ncbi:MAG: hypothetical protein HYV00_06725, partial [Deltaproteobacteria bacterium]|nr:hypothetical protein [Deltaproteobacteria bacterium]
QLPAEHAALTETPVFLHWRGELAPPLPGLTQIDQKKFFISIPEPTVGHWSNESYEGVAAEHLLQILAGSSTTINPEHLERVVPALIYRTRRNRVWKIGPPGHSPALVIKKFPSGRRKKKKPCRNWNNACELMRRGINTPRPVGFLESRTGKDPGYFVSESFEGAASARSCFERLREPEGTPEIPREFLFEEMALFAKKLHDRGVYYRDLSAGNLLVRRSSVGRIKFSLVDPGRARFFRKPLPLRLRLADLMRLVHPLSWKCREELVRCYFADDGRFDRRVYFLAFVYYDCKTAVKRFLKRAGQKRNGYGPLLRRIRR